MALSRRTGQRFQASIWPGFVDAMTALLLVLMFVLTIFMIVQFMLRETITGQETELDELAADVVFLSQALGLERDRTVELQSDIGLLESTLGTAEARIATLSSQLQEQTSALETAQGQITAFEAQVAGLLADRDTDRAQIASLDTERASLLSAQEALNLALADARGEIDAAAEAARLAAARREALQALIADLEAETETQSEQLTQNAQALSEAEATRLADAAAAQALRDRLKGAEDELTAMTLTLEAKRREAEETLTLLAAAQDVQADLDVKLAAALVAQGALQNQLATTKNALDESQSTLAEREAVLALTQDQKAQQAQALADLEARLANLDGEQQALLEKRASEAAALAALEARLEGLGAEAVASEAERAEQAARLLQAEQLIASLSQQRDSLQNQQAQTEQNLEAAQAKVAELNVSNERIEALEAQVAALTAASSEVQKDRAAVAAQLAAALAAKLAAERVKDATLSEAERRSALLAQANSELASVTEQSAEDQRKLTLLNEQVAALRGQLGTLQSLLDEAADADEASDVQLQALGSELNAALARAAAEERRRRQLEEAERKRLEAQAQDLERYRSEFFGQLRDVLGAQDGVRIEGDRFVFSSEVLFPPGGAVLSGEGQGEIAKVASILRSVADDIPDGIDWVIRVDGHTDDQPLSGLGEFVDNWELSQARALSVVRYMANFLAIPPDRLSANGFGQYQPINPDDTPEARAQNRRIELKFTEK